MQKAIKQEWVIGIDQAGLRLDQALAALLPEYSRGRIQTWIKAGQVLVNSNKALRSKDKVYLGEQLSLDVCFDDLSTNSAITPQNIALDIRYEDEDLLILNKPAGLVVHPAAGHASNTLQNALLFHRPALAAIPRAGIVHRLDKLTSGVMVVAKTLTAHQSLVEQLATRQMSRQYLALVNTIVVAGSTIDAPLARHPTDRKRRAIVANGKPAVTHYRVAQRFRAHTLLSVSLETGRTHQIRVHLASKQMPIVGDSVYGGRLRLPKQISEELLHLLQSFKRQALHAQQIRLQHPVSQMPVECSAELPQDMQNLITLLAQDAKLANH